MAAKQIEIPKANGLYWASSNPSQRVPFTLLVRIQYLDDGRLSLNSWDYRVLTHMQPQIDDPSLIARWGPRIDQPGGEVVDQWTCDGCGMSFEWRIPFADVAGKSLCPECWKARKRPLDND